MTQRVENPKIDTTKNGDTTAHLKRAEKEKDFVPLHIKRGLTILVPKEKCNEKYRKAYLEKITPKEKETRFDLLDIVTVEKLEATRHMTAIQAAKELGVSRETILKYRKELLND